MSRKEVPRTGPVEDRARGKATNAQGAAALRLSPRHIQRLKARLQAEGAPGLRHRSRGRPSPRRLPAPLTAQIDALLQTRYKDFNDCHATEKLREVEGLRVSRELVRRRRRALGLPAKHRRRARQHRHRRTPEARMGQLVQVDASPFAWLEARGPAMTLHGAIDDATSTVLALHFRPTEDLHGYATVFQQLFTQYGRPLALYGDRINILVRNDPHWSLDEQLRGRPGPHAPRPHPARPRHRLYRGGLPRGQRPRRAPLAHPAGSPHQRTPPAPHHHPGGRQRLSARVPADLNPRFTRPPADAAPAWRRAPRDLALVLSCRYTRRVARDNTVHLGPRWIQLPPGPHQRSYARCRVELRELLDGRLVVLHEGAILATQPAPPDFVLTPHSAPSSDRRHPAHRPVPSSSAAFPRARGPAHGSGSTRRPRDKVYPSPKPAICTPRGAPPVAQGHYQKGPGPLPGNGMTFSCCS